MAANDHRAGIVATALGVAGEHEGEILAVLFELHTNQAGVFVADDDVVVEDDLTELLLLLSVPSPESSSPSTGSWPSKSPPAQALTLNERAVTKR